MSTSKNTSEMQTAVQQAGERVQRLSPDAIQAENEAANNQVPPGTIKAYQLPKGTNNVQALQAAANANLTPEEHRANRLASHGVPPPQFRGPRVTYPPVAVKKEESKIKKLMKKLSCGMLKEE